MWKSLRHVYEGFNIFKKDLRFWAEQFLCRMRCLTYNLILKVPKLYITICYISLVCQKHIIAKKLVSQLYAKPQRQCFPLIFIIGVYLHEIKDVRDSTAFSQIFHSQSVISLMWFCVRIYSFSPLYALRKQILLKLNLL